MYIIGVVLVKNDSGELDEMKALSKSQKGVLKM